VAHAESVTLFARTTDWVGLAAAELELAHACRRLGDHATGTTWVHEAAALYERLQDVTGYTACLDAMADLLVQLGQPDEALARADLAVAAAVQHLDSFTQHRAERTRGRALAALHRDGEAEESFRASAAGFEAMGRPFSLAGTLRDLSGLLGRQGRRAEALAVLHRERDVLKRAGARDLSAIERLLHDAALKPALRD
jgi:tetratricopeptide (TPR) repeat protein